VEGPRIDGVKVCIDAFDAAVAAKRDVPRGRAVWVGASLAQAFPVCTPVRFIIYPWIATVTMFQG